MNKASTRKNNMEDNLYSKWSKVRARQADASHFQWEIDSISRWTFRCVCSCLVCVRATNSVWLNRVVSLYSERPFLMRLLVFVIPYNMISVPFAMQAIPYSFVSVQYLLNRSCWRTHSHRFRSYVRVWERKKNTAERCWHQFNVERKKKTHKIFRREWNESLYKASQCAPSQRSGMRWNYRHLTYLLAFEYISNTTTNVFFLSCWNCSARFEMLLFVKSFVGCVLSCFRFSICIDDESEKAIQV